MSNEVEREPQFSDKTSINIIKLFNTLDMSMIDKDYNIDLIDEFREKFNEFEQRMFMLNLYFELNYDINNEFIINIRDIWRWLGFARIEQCRKLLFTKFKKNVDYIIYYNNEIKKETIKKETVKISINCFNKLCIKANTEESTKFQDFHIKFMNTALLYIKEKGHKMAKEKNKE